ncbi:oligosaccharide flippase family protein [Flavobacterium sp. W20_MBD1_R3]|uniref:oligosaccharide flippase family protein n=1 Tax=Flavobacterium sp. W20_MBD1_R3 TaxID=3240278 RepID=UPI003F905187
MIKNVFLSFGINFINFLFPVILIPFYIRVFGITNYGLIAICISLINYISVINDYSWNILGPAKIGQIGPNTTAVNHYISTVINTKLALIIPSFLVLFVLVQLYKDINSNTILCISLFIMLFSRSQNSHWIFIGLNKVMVYFVINSIFKISTIVIVLLCIKQRESFQYLFFILGFFDSMIFIFSLLYLYLKCDYKYTPTSLKNIFLELQNGFKMFLTNLTICSILNSGTLILGLFFESKIIGIYSVAEKIIMLCKHTIGVLFQGIFPKISRLGVSNLKELNHNLRLIFRSYLFLYALGTLLLIVFAKKIIPFLSNENIEESSRYLILLSPIPLIASLNQSAYITLVLHEKKNIYFSGYFIGLLINLSLSFILTYFFKVEGMIATLIITELFITIFLNYNILTHKYLNFFNHYD